MEIFRAAGVEVVFSGEPSDRNKVACARATEQPPRGLRCAHGNTHNLVALCCAAAHQHKRAAAAQPRGQHREGAYGTRGQCARQQPGGTQQHAPKSTRAHQAASHHITHVHFARVPRAQGEEQATLPCPMHGRAGMGQGTGTFGLEASRWNAAMVVKPRPLKEVISPKKREWTTHSRSHRKPSTRHRSAPASPIQSSDNVSHISHMDGTDGTPAISSPSRHASRACGTAHQLL